MSKTLLTDEIVKEQLEQDGIMEEPDAPWLLEYINENHGGKLDNCLLYTSPSPRDVEESRMPSSA